jgi:WNK lysine deficient protein kinase
MAAAAVPTTDIPDEFSSSPTQTPEESDGATVSSVPDERDIGNSDLDDIMSSPHGNNAIVERSPGGRYVRFMEKLGSGASKDVYRAYDTQEGIEVAWNVVHLAGVPKNERIRIVNEVRLLERLHHHNIISFHGSWVNREKQEVNFVTEILSSGTLQSFINKVQVIRWKIAKRWALQILKGLEYLHSQDPPVIHRDLKCENIFINGTSGDLRIGDLGLSTVHQNGKALSVLGTPEFMAPDMYEETAYDEKVDIYAFGMCLLEIFTKEIPYRECNNPAQIYKKVIRGDPPDCLKRLKSRHARDFIILCLGTKDENGNYIRPSATELIAHPFLQFRPADDDEVEVDPPIQERTIREVPETSSGGAKVAKVVPNQVKKPASSASTDVTLNMAPIATPAPIVAASPANRARDSTRISSEEIGPDTYEEMPDSETAFRQPKVLMGRGQELLREGETVVSAPVEAKPLAPRDGEAPEQDGSVPETNVRAVQPSAPTAAPAMQQTTTSSTADEQNQASAFHFLVAAAVLEDEFSNTRPYGDEILKLVVTLPVEGQTQNVQFDFHLVEDDAIQVAKEMVAELGIPQAAVLEISETISGLARAARVKQDKYLARINEAHHQRSRSVSQSVAGMQQLGLSDILQTQHQSIGHGPSVVSHSPIPDYMNLASIQQQQGQQVSQQRASTGSLPPINTPLQSQTMQQMGQTEQSIQSVPLHVGHNQQPLMQQQSWSNQPQGNGTASAPSDQDPNYGHHSHVRTMSNGNQVELPALGPTYGGQVPMQQQHVQMQTHQGHQQGQNQDGQGGYAQPPLQQLQRNSGQQHESNGQPTYGQPQAQHHIGHQQQQQQVQNGGQQFDGQAGFGVVPTAQQHAQGMNQPQPQQPQGHTMMMQQQQPQQGMQNQGQGGQVSASPSYDYSQQGPTPPQEQQNRGQGMQVQGTSGQLPQSYQPNHEQHVQGQYMQQGQPYSQDQGMAQQLQMLQPPTQQGQRISMSSQNQSYGQPMAMPSHQMQPQRQPPPMPAMQQIQQPSLQGQQPVPHQAQNSQSGHEVGGALQQPHQNIPPTVDIHSNSLPQPRPIVGDEAPASSPEKISQRRRSSSSLSENAAIADSKDRDHINGVLGVPSINIEDEDFNDEKLAAELRKLDEDFQKTMVRAQKVFDTRMDNLSRTQVQREAQHLKTLEKHEKERADFEKRRQQEEIEQNRRIEQLQRDWAKRREAMRQKKQMEEAQAAAAGNADQGHSSIEPDGSDPLNVGDSSM